jgi:hypothetical protein
MKPVYFFINGIKNKPGDPRGWTDGAARTVGKILDVQTYKWEYACTATFRWLKQNQRAKDFAEDVNYWGKPVVIVAHSNGCDVVLKALPLIRVPILELHLVSGACSEDFAKNGLNQAYGIGKVKSVFVYMAGRDAALNFWAKWSKRLGGWMGLGYDRLGALGPKNHEFDVTLIYEPTYKHSDWFKGPVFDRFLNYVAGIKRPWGSDLSRN